jgi:hypothetical protein
MGRFNAKKAEEIRSILEGIVPENDRKEDYSVAVAKQIVIKALGEGCDITTACGLAKIPKGLYAKWLRKDSWFATEAVYARETAVRELLLKCKGDTSQSFKLLKNVAKGRYMDDPGVQNQGNTVQILMNIPRPAHVLAKGEAVKKITSGDEKSE